MNEVLDWLERFSKILTWQMIFVFLLLFARKSIISILNSFSILLGKANRFIYDGKQLTIEEIIRKVEEKDEVIKEKEREIKNIEDGGIQTIKSTPELSNSSDNAETLKKYSGRNIRSFQNEENKINLEAPLDPLKGEFGGKNVLGNLLLDAKVNELPTGLFKINISFNSTDKTEALTGSVKFYLHPTFHPDTRIVKIEKGIARLTLISYGSFTLGAEYEGKRLELDLAELEGVSEDFKNK